MTKQKKQTAVVDMAFLGTVRASYKNMVSAFGKPRKCEGKTRKVEWTVELFKGYNVVVYDYDKRTSRLQSVRKWGVDGVDSDAVWWIRGMLGQDTK